MSTTGFFQTYLVLYNGIQIHNRMKPLALLLTVQIGNIETQKALTSAGCQTEARLLALELGWKMNTLMQSSEFQSKATDFPPSTHWLHTFHVFPVQDLPLGPFPVLSTASMWSRLCLDPPGTAYMLLRRPGGNLVSEPMHR